MTAAAFALFLAGLAACLAKGWNVAWALTGGLCLFFLLGLYRGFSPRALCAMAWRKGKTSMVVVRILLLIGAITGLWRAGGTIALCIVYGIRLIQPSLFLLVAFLLTAVLSYALGTSFGVASTAGVVMMALARSGGVNELLAAGAVLSGVYVGDRCSPASSSASLVAAVTETDLYRNVRCMLRTGLLPLVLTAVIFAVLSVRNPISAVDEGVLSAMEGAFTLTWPAIVPAVIIVVLPLFRMPIHYVMALSIAAGAALSILLQGLDPLETLRAAILGYSPASPALSEILAGGGVVSMASSCAVVLLTSLYTGILEGIGALRSMEEKALAAAGRVKRLPAMIGVSLACVMVFCNQAVGVMLSAQLLHKAYDDREELAMDLENTAITLAGLVPWSIASTVPLAMLGVGAGALPFSVFLWLVPLCYLPTKGLFFPEKREGQADERKERSV